MSYSHYYEKSGMLHGSVPLIMGTRLDALLFGKNPVELDAIWNGAITEMERLHSLLNRFDPDSELSLLNKTAGHAPAGASEELWDILLDCRKYHELTLGYFDITLSDFNKVDFDMANHTLFFRERELSLDLGGYAKGYSMKKVRKMLYHAGIHQAFFNLATVL